MTITAKVRSAVTSPNGGQLARQFLRDELVRRIHAGAAFDSTRLDVLASFMKAYNKVVALEPVDSAQMMADIIAAIAVPVTARSLTVASPVFGTPSLTAIGVGRPSARFSTHFGRSPLAHLGGG